MADNERNSRFQNTEEKSSSSRGALEMETERSKENVERSETREFEREPRNCSVAEEK